MKEIHNLIKTKRTSSADDTDTHRGFTRSLDPSVITLVGQNVKEVCFHPVEGKEMKTFVFHSDEEKTTLCEAIKMEEAMVPKEYVLFAHGTCSMLVVDRKEFTGFGIVCI